MQWSEILCRSDFIVCTSFLCINLFSTVASCNENITRLIQPLFLLNSSTFTFIHYWSVGRIVVLEPYGVNRSFSQSFLHYEPFRELLMKRESSQYFRTFYLILFSVWSKIEKISKKKKKMKMKKNFGTMDRWSLSTDVDWLLNARRFRNVGDVRQKREILPDKRVLVKLALF